jgi:hypothetical protein
MGEKISLNFTFQASLSPSFLKAPLLLPVSTLAIFLTHSLYLSIMSKGGKTKGWTSFVFLQDLYILLYA